MVLSLVFAPRSSAWILPSNRSSTARLFSSNRLLPSESPRNTYCVLRHCRSLANEAKTISSHPEVATIMHGLSKVGQEQAEKVGANVVDYYINNSFEGIAILTSDYLCAKETAIYAAKAVLAADLPIVDDGVVIV